MHEIRHCDNLDGAIGLPSLAAESVDVILADPPYEAEAHTQQRRIKRWAPGGYVADVEPLDFEPMTPGDREAFAFHAKRVVRRWVLVFCQIEAVHLWRESFERAGLVYKRTCIWHKPNGQPQLSGDRPGMGYESIVCAHPKGRSRWNGGGRIGHFSIELPRGGAYAHGHSHPTQKPLKLMRELVELFTDPGELVLDPYAGSGTTGVACKQLDRRFLGMEKRADYAEVARRRLEGLSAKASGQIDMFG
jgi:site-specific DNA-methyltransferase (adenine-specific)